MALKTNQTLTGICQTFVKSLFPSWWGRRGITGLPRGGEVFTTEFHIFYHFNKANLTIAVPCFFKTYFNSLSKISTQLQVNSVVKFLKLHIFTA